MTDQARPLQHRSSWELRAIVRALSKLPALNTPEESQRLVDARRELAARSQKDVAE
jgi:hypothetical protein